MRISDWSSDVCSSDRWWLHHSLKGLSAALEDKGAPLLLLRGKCDEVLAELARETGIRRVHAVQHHEPWWRRAEARDRKSVVSGKSVSVRVDIGGRRIIKKQKKDRR